MATLANKADRAPEQASAPEPFRFRKRLWAILGIVGVATVAGQALTDWQEKHGFLINATDSLPNWAFVIHKTALPKRGEYVFFLPPANPLVIRHFGSKPQMFGKVVYGMPGDTVEHRGPWVVVAGRVVSHMKPLTKTGEVLHPGPTGRVPDGCYYVGTPHKDGFDSRYAEIGYACSRNIVGVGTSIL